MFVPIHDINDGLNYVNPKKVVRIFTRFEIDKYITVVELPDHNLYTEEDFHLVIEMFMNNK
jgi:hypothetical protein